MSARFQNFGQILEFLPNFRNVRQISKFRPNFKNNGQISDFWLNFRIFAKFQKCWQNFKILAKFQKWRPTLRILANFGNVVQNFGISEFRPNFRNLGKLWTAFQSCWNERDAEWSHYLLVRKRDWWEKEKLAVSGEIFCETLVKLAQTVEEECQRFAPITLWGCCTVEWDRIAQSLTFFWAPLVKHKVKICPNLNFVINLIWNVQCSFGEHS